VRVHDAKACVRGGAYLVHVDAATGAILAVQPQR
jgi:hypothetical protein